MQALHHLLKGVIVLLLLVQALQLCSVGLSCQQSQLHRIDIQHCNSTLAALNSGTCVSATYIDDCAAVLLPV